MIGRNWAVARSFIRDAMILALDRSRPILGFASVGGVADTVWRGPASHDKLPAVRQADSSCYLLMSKMSVVSTRDRKMPPMEDDDSFIFSIDTFDADMSFQAEEPELLADDDIRLLSSLEDDLDTETD